VRQQLHQQQGEGKVQQGQLWPAAGAQRYGSLCRDGVGVEGDHALLPELSLEQLEEELLVLERECLGGLRSSGSQGSSDRVTAGGGSSAERWCGSLGSGCAPILAAGGVAGSGGSTVSHAYLWADVVGGDITEKKLPLGKQGGVSTAGGGPSQQQQHGEEVEGVEPWQGLDAGPPPPWELGGRSNVSDVAAARQAAVEGLLARNAQLLQTL
jgi:hypothetical protein